MSDLYDVIILGAGPTGLSAGIYAGRSRLRTLIIDKENYGGQIRITNEVVNYPGIFHTSGAQLSDEMRKQAVKFGVEFTTANIVDVDFSDVIKVVKAEDGKTFNALSIIIATGARPRMLGFKGEEEFKGHGVGYCATCDGEFFTGMEVFVIGAGFAAAEESMFLTRFAKKVTIIARKSEFACSKAIAEKVLSHDKIEVKFNTEIQLLEGTNVPKRAVFFNNQTKESWEHNASENESFGVFVFVGYEPLSEVFKNHVEMDEYGYILADEDMKTNIAGVYAAGDIRPKRLRQLVTAVADGAIASTSIERYVEEIKEKYSIEVESQDEEIGQEEPEALIDEGLKEQLNPIIDRFEKNIVLNIVLDSSDFAKEMKSFGQELVGINDKLKINIYQKGENKAVEEAINTDLFPVMAVFLEDGKYCGVNFHGIPGGHEFNSFVLGLYNCAGPGQRVENEILEKINNIDKKVNMKICVSLTCTMCPDVVTATQLIASKNDNIVAEMLDLSKFLDLKSKYSIMSVPALIINDEKVVFGKKSIDEIVGMIG